MEKFQRRTVKRAHTEKSQQTFIDFNMLFGNVSEVKRMLVRRYQRESQEENAQSGHFSLPKYLSL